MNRQVKPLRLIRNIHKILMVKNNASCSSKGKKRYLVPKMKNTILVV